MDFVSAEFIAALRQDIETRLKAVQETKVPTLVFIFPSLKNWTEVVQADYLASIPEVEQRILVRNCTKSYPECTYQGDLFNGQRHGYGTAIYHDGREYCGEWKYDQRDGRGEEHYSDGSVYQGFLKEGTAHGFGVYRSHNGEMYEGDWLAGVKSGRGRWRGSAGDEYSGYWQNSVANGWGKHTWPSGDSYEGEWVDCNKHGFGIQTNSSSATEYRGAFQTGKIHGFGQLIDTDGSVYQGYFEDGVKHGPGILTQANKSVYVGEFCKGAKTGRGFFQWPSGNQYIGWFEREKRQGKGEMKWSDGSVYVGDWKAGIQHGYGEMTFSDGRQEKKGRFENNTFKGKCKMGRVSLRLWEINSDLCGFEAFSYASIWENQRFSIDVEDVHDGKLKGSSIVWETHTKAV